MSLRWQQFSICVDVGLDTFFERSENGHYVYLREARLLCGRCPVSSQCLDYALTNNLEGIWGGTTEFEREAQRDRFLNDGEFYEMVTPVIESFSSSVFKEEVRRLQGVLR